MAEPPERDDGRTGGPRARKTRGSIPILQLWGILLASIQVDLHDAIADAFQEDVLVALAERHASGLVIDISGLEIVDSYVARVIVDTGRMARLMGVETVLVGMRPEVAATLVRMGFRMEGVRTALDLDEGMALARSLVERAAGGRG